MVLYRIKALIIRYLMLTFRDFHRFIDLIYWPILDIIIWGFTAHWIQCSQEQVQVSSILLTALVFWQVLFRAQMEVSFNFLDELWSHNLVNLFSTPVTFFEWVSAAMIVGLIKSAFTFLLGSVTIWILYKLLIFKSGLILIPFLLLIVMSGWTIGFLTTATVTYWGQKVQTLVWVIAWAFAPFSGVFYPISVLPYWGQCIAAVIPMSYFFEAVRGTLMTGIVPIKTLALCCLLNGVYMVIALALFKYSFEKSKIYGLARLERYE